MTAKESRTFYNIKKNTDRTKSTGRKVGFTAVFMNSLEERHYQKKPPFTQLEMTAMREMGNDLLSSLLAIENNIKSDLSHTNRTQ